MAAELAASKINEKLTDLGSLLESIGVQMGRHDRLLLGVGAACRAASGRILARRR